MWAIDHHVSLPLRKFPPLATSRSSTSIKIICHNRQTQTGKHHSICLRTRTSLCITVTCLEQIFQAGSSVPQMCWRSTVVPHVPPSDRHLPLLLWLPVITIIQFSTSLLTLCEIHHWRTDGSQHVVHMSDRGHFVRCTLYITWTRE